MKRTMNRDERVEWVRNDEALYNEWKASGKGLYAFVAERREEIDAYVAAQLNKGPRR